MARFIENRAAPGWIYLFLIPATLAGLLLAASLYARERISTLGFIGLLGLVVVSLFLADEHFRRGSRREVVIAPGKKGAQVAGSLDSDAKEFRSGSTPLALLLVALVIVPLCLIRPLYLWIVAKDTSAATTHLFQALPVVLILTVLLLTMRRIRVGGDHVQVIHPFFAARRDRSIKLSEIDSVELKEIGRGGTEVRIKVRDGTAVYFRISNAKKASALMDALKQGVARSKPPDPVWSELA